MTYHVRETAYPYDIENIIRIFGFEKGGEGADLVLSVEEGQLCLRGNGVDFSAPLFCSKNELKRRVFLCLSETFGKLTDWGILVGVRPVKLASGLLLRFGPEEAAEKLCTEYLLSAEKADLLVEIAQVENRIAPDFFHVSGSEQRSGTPPRTPDMPVSLYISVPFCPARCRYCSFPMQPLATKRKLLLPYFETLREELIRTLEMLTSLGCSVDCIYVGGGTPSTLSFSMIEELGNLLRRYVNIRELKEFTFEAGRTDTVSGELFELLREIGVGRVSVNAQTFSSEALGYALRSRKEGEFEEAFRLARSAGLKINTDLILGLPMETEDSYLRGLQYLIECAPENITVHALALKKGSPLFGESVLSASGSPEGNQDTAEIRERYLRMSIRGEELLRQSGYLPYYLYRQKRILANLENIGYTKNRDAEVTDACLYNSRIMSERYDIIAVGTGGVSKICFPHENRHEQLPGIRSVEEYMARFEHVLHRISRTKELLSEKWNALRA